MDNHLHSSYTLILFLLFVPLRYCQTITEPKLISVTPVNSTALTVNWRFADTSIDQSDLIQIHIVFYEFFYGLRDIYASSNFTFTSTNKTVTNLTKNFQLVNAYYYVCFSSNSTITNASRHLIVNSCILTRTCLRSNAECPGPSTVAILPASISSISFIISIIWPNDLPYSWNSSTTQLVHNGQAGTRLSSTANVSYTNQQYQFTGLQPETTYRINTSFTYTLLNRITQTNTTILTVTTSYSSKLIYNSNLLAFSLLFHRSVF